MPSAVIAASKGCRKVSVALLALLAAPAMAAECPPPEAPAKVRFSISVAEPVLRNDRPREAIAALAGAANLHGGLQAGLTQSQTSFRLEPTVRWMGVKGGSACVTLTDVVATWDLRQTTIDVASQYRPGSCEYAVILDHEREHVRLTRRAFERHAPKLEARLRELATGMKPFATREDVDDAASRVNRRLVAAIKPFTEAFNEESRRANAAIDTPESYRAVAAKCKRW